MHRQTDHVLSDLGGNRGALRTAEVRIGRLLIQRDRIVHGGGNALLLEPSLKLIAVLDQEGVLGKDAGAVWLGPG